MSMPESPADEYEKKLRARHGNVRRELDLLLMIFVVLHGVAFATGGMASRANSGIGLLFAVMFGLSSLVYAVRPAALTVHHF
jgi:hypothetical protein